MNSRAESKLDWGRIMEALDKIAAMPLDGDRGDPTITSAKVLGGKTVQVGSRVKHFGQRFTGRATATVVGFRSEVGWIKVLVERDTPDSWPWSEWDWDRTEVAPDV